MELTVKPLWLMTLAVDKSYMTYLMHCGEPVDVAVVSWYVNAGGQDILIDTGSSPDVWDQWHVGRYGVPPAKPTKLVQSVEDALGKIGKTPDDISYVIQTHLHFDHVANTRKFRNAKVIIQEKELSFAYAPHTLFAGEYVKECFVDLKWEIINGEKEIVPGIRVLPTPGHSPGAQSVCIDTEKGLAIITGFCATKETFEVPDNLKATWPVFAPGTHCDSLQAFDSALKVRGMADILIPLHDTSFAGMERIPA
jgi:N-acyl homoserine lactone hydrolase